MIEKVLNFPQLGGISINYYIGKSAQENIDIIDAAEPHHLWFHVEGHPSGHVIAAIPDSVKRRDLRYVIKQGAVLCKQHSKFASSKNLDIVYTRVDQIQKTDTLGSVIISGEKTVSI
jgi:predicted ribosome quality control (RQC) complex YloA/Tae2 family protein